MSLENLKITDSKINQNGVSAAPDKLTGTAAQNKEVFDNLVRKIVAESINGVIDTLTSSAGAQSIGMNDLYSEQEGLTVFTAVEKMHLKTNADKADKTVTNYHIKNVEHDEKTGIFRFIRENDEKIIIDTALEKISVNFSYDSDTESILIHLADGTIESVPLSSFISETDWIESDTVQFNVEQHKVSAFIRYGSITDEHLSSLLRDTLISYVTESGNSAVAAQNAADSARGFSVDAEVSAVNASEYEKKSENYKESARRYADITEGYKQNAEAAAESAEVSALEAIKARDEAVEIAGFNPTDYVQKNDFAEINGDAGLVCLSSPTYGVNLKDFDGIKRLIVYAATEKTINEKGNAYQPLTPKFIDLIVKIGLTDNQYTLTDDEKAKALEFIGAMSSKYDSSFTVNGRTYLNGLVYVTEGCDIYNENDSNVYLHTGNIQDLTATPFVTTYTGSGEHADYTDSNDNDVVRITGLPSNLSYGIFYSNGYHDQLTGENAWHINFNYLRNQEDYVKVGAFTFDDTNPSGGDVNEFDIMMRYTVTGYDGSYSLSWYAKRTKGSSWSTFAPCINNSPAETYTLIAI